MKAWAYWAGVLALVLFGWLAILTLGAPFVLLGLTLAVLFPWRRRRGVLATGMAVILGLVVGYALVAPLSCSATLTSVPGESFSDGSTTCSNLLGIRYEGDGDYDPSLFPALVAGVVLAVVAGVATAWSSRRRWWNVSSAHTRSEANTRT